LLPFFNLLFAAARGLYRFVRFEPHEGIHAVSSSETRYGLVLVLPDPLREIGCYPGIQGSVGLTGEQINVEHVLSGFVVPAKAGTHLSTAPVFAEKGK
jgi:hypothetical protein